MYHDDLAEISFKLLNLFEVVQICSHTANECVAYKLLKYLTLKQKKNDMYRERNKEVNLQFWHVCKSFLFSDSLFFINYVNVSPVFKNLGLNHCSKCETQLFRALLIITRCFYPKTANMRCNIRLHSDLVERNIFADREGGRGLITV